MCLTLQLLKHGCMSAIDIKLLQNCCIKEFQIKFKEYVIPSEQQPGHLLKKMRRMTYYYKKPCLHVIGTTFETLSQTLILL